LESKLFLKRGKDASCWVRAWPGGICWRVELRESEFKVEPTDQACPVDDGSIGEHRKHAGERRNALTPAKNRTANFRIAETPFSGSRCRNDCRFRLAIN